MIKNLILVILFALFAGSSSAEVYFTVEEGLGRIFPVFDEVYPEKRFIENQEVEVYTVFNHGKISGRAVKLSEMGKNYPITFLVGVDTQAKIAGILILEFRDMFGSEIKRKSFLRQFRGKTLKNPLKIGRDIDAVTGATISSKAAASAVKKSLQIISDLAE